MIKNFKSALKSVLAIVMIVLSVLACKEPVPTPEPEPEPEPQPTADCVFDLYVSVGKHGGMSQNKNGTLMRRVLSLEADQPEVQFTGKGVEITSDYTLESIVKGKYYYQVPQNNAKGFVKFHVELNGSNESIVVDKSVPFQKNTFYARKYTHTWLDGGKTLLVVGTDSKHVKAVYTKFDAETLAIKEEGVLDIEPTATHTTLSTAGLAVYRESDNKIFYFYVLKAAEGITDAASSITRIAVINPSTMAIESDKMVQNAVMESLTGTAYGELMQEEHFFDENGDLYVAGVKSADSKEYGVVRRIKKTSIDFDPSYNALVNAEGKILTIQYMGNGKAFAYMRNEELGTATTAISHAYSILDLENCKHSRVQYNGSDLGYCGGRFSQRSAVVGGKVYFGVTEKDYGQNQVFIYDIASGKVTPGVKLQNGLYFDIIRALDK